MAKKQFEWVRDADEPLVPFVERQTRREKGAKDAQTTQIVEQLLTISPGARKHLPMDEDIFVELKILDNIKSNHRSARKRQTDRIRKLLRPRDLTDLMEALGGNDARVAKLEEELDQLVRWRGRLIDEGDAGLQAFLELYPEGDRQHLRSLATRCRKATEGSDASRRAAKALMAALRKVAGI